MSASETWSHPARPARQLADAEEALTHSEIEACWQSIGVYGTGSCQKLAEFIHCRNCPIYSAGARHLLNRPLPAEYRHESAAHLAKKQNLARTTRTSAVIFRIGPEWLGLPAEAFQEIAERRPIHSLPHRRVGIVAGLANIRGELLVCVSLGRLLGIEQILPQSNRISGARLLAAQWQGSRLVFAVDEVHGIHRFPPGELRDTPATIAKASASFTQGIFLWNNRPVGYLQPGALFAALNRSLS